MYNYAVALEAYPINYYGNCTCTTNSFTNLLQLLICNEVKVQQTLANDGIHHQRQIYYTPDSKHSRRPKTQEDLLYQRDCAQLLASTQLFTRHLLSL